MSNQPPKFEEIKKIFGSYPKQMIVNEDVAKTMEFKTQTRRLKTNWKVGDVLWIRESVKIVDYTPAGNYGGTWCYGDSFWYEYVSDGKLDSMEIPERLEDTKLSWLQSGARVSNGCIKEMARTFVRVVEVRDERLEDITIEDVISEGYNGYMGCSSRNYSYESELHNIKSYQADEDVDKYSYDAFRWYAELWDSTAPKGKKWMDNPEVKVIVLEKLKI